MRALPGFACRASRTALFGPPDSQKLRCFPRVSYSQTLDCLLWIFEGSFVPRRALLSLLEIRLVDLMHGWSWSRRLLLSTENHHDQPVLLLSTGRCSKTPLKHSPFGLRLMLPSILFMLSPFIMVAPSFHSIQECPKRVIARMARIFEHRFSPSRVV